MSLLHNLNLQTNKKLKQYSSSTLPRICTMAIFANMKCFRKEQKNYVGYMNAPKLCKRFKSTSSLVMASKAFNFIAIFDIDYSMFKMLIETFLCI